MMNIGKMTTGQRPFQTSNIETPSVAMGRTLLCLIHDSYLFARGGMSPARHLYEEIGVSLIVPFLAAA